jgi:hypothetical protein
MCKEQFQENIMQSLWKPPMKIFWEDELFFSRASELEEVTWRSLLYRRPHGMIVLLRDQRHMERTSGSNASVYSDSGARARRVGRARVCHMTAVHRPADYKYSRVFMCGRVADHLRGKWIWHRVKKRWAVHSPDSSQQKRLCFDSLWANGCLARHFVEWNSFAAREFMNRLAD